MSTDIEQKVIQSIAENLKIEEAEISIKSKFIDDLGADSLDFVELMMHFEAEFGCDIPDEEAAKMTTVEDAVNHIKEHIKSQNN